MSCSRTQHDGACREKMIAEGGIMTAHVTDFSALTIASDFNHYA